MPVDPAMVAAAERHRKFVAHLAPKGPRLGKPEVVSVCRFAPANQARLRSHELQMRFVPHASGLGQCKDTLVDSSRFHTTRPIAVLTMGGFVLVTGFRIVGLR